VALLGITVVLGWHTGNAWIVEIRPDLSPMQYLSSLLFLLSGVSLMAGALKVRCCLRLPVAMGLVVTACGMAISYHYLANGASKVDDFFRFLPLFPGHTSFLPSPPTALGFSLCGLAVLLLNMQMRARRKRFLIWLIASPAAALSLMVLSGYAVGLTETYVWGTTIGMALHSAVGMMLLGLGLMLSQINSRRTLVTDRWLPIPIAIATLTGTLVIWQALRTSERAFLRNEVRLVMEDFLTDARYHLEAPLRALERKRQRWEQRGGLPYADWRADAEAFLASEPIFSALEWADASWRVQWVIPETYADRIIGLNLREETRWDAQPALRKAEDTYSMVVSPPIELLQGGSGILVYYPLRAEEQADGFLIGVIPLKEFFQIVLKERIFEDYSITVFDGDKVLIGTPETSGVRKDATVEDFFRFQSDAWKIRITPLHKPSLSGNLPDIILLLGLLLALTLAALVYGVQVSLRKNRVIQATDRKLRKILREKETVTALLEAAGRIARVGSWEILNDQKTVIWSETTRAIHEMPPGAEITVEEGVNFYHEDDRPMIAEVVQEAFEKEIPFEFEARLRTAKGNLIWIHTRGVVARDGEGRVIGMRGVVQDIDEQKKSRDLLEERNRQLEIATAKAEAHAKAKAEFLANMSHEIRTPLNAVIGMSELLMDSHLPEREREFADTIHSSGDILLGLINDILDFSKIEAGKFDLEEVPVHVRHCLESGIDIVAGLASRKRLNLAYWIAPEVPEVILGDATRLRQIFVNLATNAIKFTAKGEIFLNLSVRRTADGDFLHTEVRDTGIGIPQERMNRLFQAFSQVDSSTTRRFGGTGLGLAISQRLVEKMGGRIWVESEVGKGSTFQFEVPLRTVDEPPELPGEQMAARSFHDLRVLIVDDTATNSWILQAQLEAWGMKPAVFERPAEALERLREGESYDIAILDVFMLEMDGYELAEEIRKLCPQEKLPILLLTSPDDYQEKLATLGIAAVLTRPVKKAALLHALEKALASAHMGLESRQALPPSSVPKLADSIPLRILVAEDNVVNQRVAALLLSRMGYDPRIVSNGLEVLDALRKHTFDVVMLDVQMPELDGLETAQRILATFGDKPRPWLIALTANALEGSREECLAAGMDDFLTKPVRVTDLARVLTRAGERANKG